jgi:hypothetical protein
VRYVPAGSLRTASAEQIFPPDSVQRNCFELYTARDHDCISNRIGSGIRSAMQMSSRYVRCAPNAVDDRADHHADRSSTSAPHCQVRRCHRSIHCWHGHATRRSALPRERFSPLTLFGHGARSMSVVAARAEVNCAQRVFPGFDPEQTSHAFSDLGSHGSYPRVGWGDSISGRNADREGAAMNQPETGKRPRLRTAVQICKRSWPRFFGNGRPSRKCCALLPIHHTTCSPYSTPFSTTQCICAEQTGALSVFPSKQAFVSLHIK